MDFNNNQFQDSDSEYKDQDIGKQPGNNNERDEMHNRRKALFD